MLGPIAIIMATKDLKRMKSGAMDPSGHRNTNIARVLGIIATIIGLLSVACTILVVTGVLVYANYTDILAMSKEDAAQTQLQMFELPLNLYHLHAGQYPSTDDGLEALRSAPTDGNLQQKWRGPYLSKAIPTDPWGNPYNYELAYDPQTNQSGYRIWSTGADSLDGTDDDIVVTSD
jgi:general secretion pathway protein G